MGLWYDPVVSRKNFHIANFSPVGSALSLDPPSRAARKLAAFGLSVRGYPFSGGQKKLKGDWGWTLTVRE
jgi:hypothetical protein